MEKGNMIQDIKNIWLKINNNWTHKKEINLKLLIEFLTYEWLLKIYIYTLIFYYE